MRKALYDAVLVDEAQDFPPAFLKLCYEMLDNHKRLVYAYDELQNLGGESLPSPEEIFGTEADGSPRVRFDAPAKNEPQRDIILEKCYRNSRPLLVTAHALGFGIYRDPPKNRDTGLVQMFDQPQLWEDIGYKVKDGELKPGSAVTLCRTDESSPRFLEEHSEISDLVQFIRFDSEEEQAEWLVGAILTNLSEDELRHDDIVVINTDPLTTRNKMGPIRRRLLDQGVSSHLAGVDTDPDIFFKPESASVTFTGIFRAKGNEAGEYAACGANHGVASLFTPRLERDLIKILAQRPVHLFHFANQLAACFNTLQGIRIILDYQQFLGNFPVFEVGIGERLGNRIANHSPGFLGLLPRRRRGMKGGRQKCGDE